MEKKSFAIGGAIGTAVGMVAMLGIALGVGSCANKDKVNNVAQDHVLVQRPKKAVVPDEDLPIGVYKLESSNLKTSTTFFDLEGVSDTGLYYCSFRGQVYSDLVLAGRDSSAKSYFQFGNGYIKISVGTGTIQTSGDTSAVALLYVTYDSVVGNQYGADLLSCYQTYTLGTLNSSGQFTEGYEPEPEPTNSGGLVSDIFTQVTASITNFAQALGNSVTEGVKLFYVDGNWTPLGILTLVSAGIALVYWCFYLIKKLLNIGVK